MIRKVNLITILMCVVILFASCTTQSVDLGKLTYSGNEYVSVNENVPQFTKDEITTDSFEQYSDLDTLGRCGVAVACIGRDIMPTEERGAIGQIKPSGWQLAK